MARRTTFCPVSENLSVIEPNSIMAPHSSVAKYSRDLFYSRLRAPHIRVGVERAQGDDVWLFVGQSHRDPELLAFRIGDAVDRKDRLPLAAIDLVFGAADDRSGVCRVENYF